jgi:hypothetical protein
MDAKVGHRRTHRKIANTWLNAEALDGYCTVLDLEATIMIHDLLVDSKTNHGISTLKFMQAVLL